MAEVDRALLTAFAVEMLEHVAACEQVLVRAATEPIYEQDFQLLLRSVHSIKGLARVLAQAGLERLAHVVESLLVAVRDRRFTLDGPAQELFLRAIDAFKVARSRIIEGGDFQADEALLRALAEADAPARAEPDPSGAADAAATSADGQGDADADAAVLPPEADLYFDQPTLIALAELFEELLPSIVRAASVGATGAQAQEDIGVLAFALKQVGFGALERAVPWLENRSRPAEFARCLCLIERLAQVLERDCGVAEAVRLSRPWLAPALLQAADERRWSDVGWLLRALVPQSPFIGLLPQIISAASPGETRRLALDLVGQSLRAELAPGAPSSDVTALAADKVRDMLEEPLKLPAQVLMSLDMRRLDLDRFRSLPSALSARLQKVAVDAAYQLFEVTLQPNNTNIDLAALAPALSRGLQPLLGEAEVVDGEPILFVLLATQETEPALRERVAQIVGGNATVVVRKLDQQAGDAHFRAKIRPIADTMGSSETQVRVPVALLDSMFGRIGQFFSVTTRFNALVFDTEVQDSLTEISDYSVLHAPQLLPKIERLVRQQNDYATLEAETHRLISMIHEMTLGLRVIPMDTLFARFPRMVRDLAQRQGKEVRLDAQSSGIRVDNGMLELLADPLMHMLRNCIDHGIESPDAREKAGKPRLATLVLHTEQRGNHIIIEVGDDGRGIDLDRVLERAIARNLVDATVAPTLSEEQITHFIFSPGFSTAERVTDTSGRGVGMDVALVNVTKLGGAIDIVTHRGRGTTFRIDIPLSKAIQSMLLAETGVQMVAFPDRMVSECVVAPASDVQSVNGQRSILIHDRFLPLFSVVDLLKLPAPPADTKNNDLAIIVCELEGRRVGFQVHRIRRRTDLLIQEMHPRIAKLPGIGGISTIGTDKIVVVVDPEGLFDLARRFAVFGLRTHAVRVAEEIF
ncbi:MAG: two-component system, chemotaxis family, sensor kinase CheA [Myxococcales bacterium]|nr:two-component system, chemotaxis family, sensor kinase CheA [Myxococcales bacterium]